MLGVGKKQQTAEAGYGQQAWLAAETSQPRDVALDLPCPDGLHAATAPSPRVLGLLRTGLWPPAMVKTLETLMALLQIYTRLSCFVNSKAEKDIVSLVVGTFIGKIL